MSVTSVTLKWSGGAITNEVNRREITRVYDVLHDTPVDADVLSVGVEAFTLGLPEMGDSFSGADPFLTVRRIGPVRMLGPMLAEVPVTFMVEGSEGEGTDPTQNPESIDVSWGFSTNIEGVQVDLDGRPIASVVGELYDPPMPVEKHDVTLSIMRNEWVYDPAMVVQYHDSINTDNLPTFGVLAGQARLRIQPVGVVNPAGDTPLIRIRYDLTFRRALPAVPGVAGDPPPGGPAHAWWRRVAHVGYRGFPLDFVGPLTEPVVLTDSQGAKLPTASKLGPDGDQLSEAAPYVFREFRQNELKPFGLLQLEQTYLASHWGQISGPVGL